MSIQIQVRNKVAVNLTPEEVIVCGNNGYDVEFSFDEEWASETVKTARFVYRKGGQNYFDDVVFTGTTVKAPVLSNINYVLIGVYAGELITSTPAVVECDKSILCGSGTHKDPTPDVYNQLIELINSGTVDGFSPIATVAQTDSGAVISITDKNGTTTATITNGKDGAKGDKGDKGDTGEKGAQGAKGDTGPQGATGATGADGKDGKDYVLTASDKAEIAEMVENATIVQAPKYVNTVEEMTDPNRPYVLISTGRIWANAETTVVSTKTEACDEGYTYPENSRLSSGNVNSGAGYTVTPFIDLLAYPVPFTLHLDGAAFLFTTNDNYTRVAMYTTEQTLIAEEKHNYTQYDLLFNVTDADLTIDSAGNGTITFNNTPALVSGAALRYIRLSGKVFGTPHVYVTYEETTTGVQWFDTSTTYAPTLTADERQSIVDDVVNQIDTELLSVIGSGEVV